MYYNSLGGLAASAERERALAPTVTPAPAPAPDYLDRLPRELTDNCPDKGRKERKKERKSMHGLLHRYSRRTLLPEEAESHVDVSGTGLIGENWVDSTNLHMPPSRAI